MYLPFLPCPPIDSILTLMTVWSLRGKIIRIAIIVSYIRTLWIVSSYNFRFRLFLSFASYKSSTFCFVIICTCIFPGKAVPEVIYTVSDGMQNPTLVLAI